MLDRVLIALMAGVAGVGATVGVVVQQTVLDREGPVAAIVPVDAAISPDGGRLSVPVFDCPGAPAAERLHSGDRIFVTAVHEDDAGWLRIRHPLDAGRELWIEAGTIIPDDDVGDLPTTPCATGVIALDPTGGDLDDEPEDELEDDGEPGEDDLDERADGPTTTQPGTGGTTSPARPGTPTTRPGSPPTTRPGSPPPTGPGSTPTTQPGGPTTVPGTTTTTAPPAGPSIGNVARSHAQLTELDGQGISCPPSTPRSSTVTASVSAPAGVKSVQLQYSFAKDGGGTEHVTKTMAASGGGYQATIGTVAAGTVSHPGTPVTWSVRVVDQLDRVATFNAGAGHGVEVRSIWNCFG